MFNRRKPEALLANGVLPKHPTEEQCIAVDRIELAVVVPVETEQVK